ncbi:MAG: hypothetical protein AAFV19_16740 [Pseudomonadota bacterium]
MKRYVASKSLATASELLVVGNMRRELVPHRFTMTYATRLSLLLKTFHEIRKRGLETYEGGLYSGPIDLLQTLYFFQWTVFDEGQRMLLAVKFDRPFETYFRRLVDIGGPVLDAILCHCEEFEGHSCWEGYDGFAAWGRKHQVESHLFAGAQPDLTVDDIRYLKAMEELQRQAPDPAVLEEQMRRLMTEDVEKRAAEAAKREPQRAREQALRVIDAMFALSPFFPEGKDPSDADSRDRFFLHRLTKSLVKTFEPTSVTAKERADHAMALAWFEEEVEWKPLACLPTPRPAPKKGTIQAGILSPYRDVTHGRIALVRFTAPGSGNALLKKMLAKKLITLNARAVDPKGTKPSTENKQGEVVTNMSLSVSGLRALGLSETEMRHFPSEFREGMAQRAGPLGDLGPNNPKNWSLPKDPAGHEIQLTSIDMIVTMRIAAEWPAKRRPHVQKALDDAAGTIDAAMLAFTKLAASCKVEVMAVEEVHHNRGDGGQVQEHFGFADGISQPALEPRADGTPNYDRDSVRLGEALIGYANERLDPDKPPRPEVEMDAILDCGTFQVIRKLRQDVDGFHRFVTQTNGRIDRDVIEAKVMGRSRNGMPLVHDHEVPHTGPDYNDFDYASDPHGDICPLSAHTRRTNPREPRKKMGENRYGKHEVLPTARIIRRGFSYGPPYTPQTRDAERGLFFTCFNASIAEQFEVVQRWISGGNITKIYSKHDDPLMGLPEPGEKRFFRFQHNGKTENLPLPDAPLVKLEWGIYLFTPSVAAIKALAGRNPMQRYAGDVPANVQRGMEAIAKLNMYETYVRYKASLPTHPGEPKIDPDERACYAWKAALEDLGAKTQDLSDDIWAAVNAYHDGVLRTPFGVLVGSAKHVTTVFEDKGQTFSVRSNWERMRHALGELYLGMDPKPGDMQSSGDKKDEKLHAQFRTKIAADQYQQDSKIPNAWMYSAVDRKRAFTDSRAAAQAWLDKHVPSGEDGTVVDLREFINDVMGQLAVDWFGLPTDGSIDVGGVPGDKPNVPDDLVPVSLYFFGPKPADVVAEEAKRRGNALTDAVKTWTKKVWDNPPKDTLLSHLIASGEFDVERTAVTVAGTTSGFVGPTGGMLTRALVGWKQRVTNGEREGEELWHVQRNLAVAVAQNKGVFDLAAAEAAIYQTLAFTMKSAPAPDLLHRVAIRKAKLGKFEIKPGDRIVLGIGSAARDDPGSERLLFGGDFKGAKTATAHACPGQELAWGVMLGMIATLLFQTKIEPETGRFNLRLTI